MFFQSTEGKNKTAVLAQQQLLQYQYRVLRAKGKTRDSFFKYSLRYRC